ncbi:hypothetical protein D9619_009690 [Psilocybe cf. subviscida]|uniref:Uncharacterized protein n=1 Tax=Psilocybe cf. subviscida TaxID=2480587 RepID=A0A8H5F6A0_9AGAR|nr:hypothetical protein D9619_009690 [Psilocybe cf. subviscida]
MSPSASPFVARVFSKPTEEDIARLARSSLNLTEDYQARRSTMGLIFTAPTTGPSLLGLSTSHMTALGLRIDRESDSSNNQETDDIALGYDVSETTQGLDIPSGGHSQSYEAQVDNNLSLTNTNSSDMNNVLPPADDSDLEWDQPGAFDFLANIETDNFEFSDNDTRSSGYTEFSPLRPRRLFEASLLNRATHGCSSLRESAVWNDGDDTADLSSLADANDLSHYHADLEDELDDNDTDEDEDDSDYEYSSACSTLAASDESGDEDFFDARSDSESSA